MSHVQFPQARPLVRRRVINTDCYQIPEPYNHNLGLLFLLPFLLSFALSSARISGRDPFISSRAFGNSSWALWNQTTHVISGHRSLFNRQSRGVLPLTPLCNACSRCDTHLVTGDLGPGRVFSPHPPYLPPPGIGCEARDDAVHLKHGNRASTLTAFQSRHRSLHH